MYSKSDSQLYSSDDVTYMVNMVKMNANTLSKKAWT